MRNKEETIVSLSDTINSLEEIKNKLKKEKKDLEIELTRQSSELEGSKKDILLIKERYDREFELVSSSLYSLGLSYWSMKLEYNQKLTEKPTWLSKERQKFFNGDF